MENIKNRIVAFWLSHVFLRRVGKRYPEYLVRWVNDITDDETARKIMSMRYIGDSPMKFEAIAYELNMAPRRIFEKHKKVIDHMISNI